MHSIHADLNADLYALYLCIISMQISMHSIHAELHADFYALYLCRFP
jgi:hypothetical protein